MAIHHMVSIKIIIFGISQCSLSSPDHRRLFKPTSSHFALGCHHNAMLSNPKKKLHPCLDLQQKQV